VLHASTLSPTQSAPPFDGDGEVHERVLKPPPHVALHVVNSVQPPLTGTGHASVLHASEELPSQSRPPPDGTGLVHERVLIPPPHEAEQLLNSVQPPLTDTTHTNNNSTIS
jgi:hypothetical protein